jgi:hypothetical protein
VRLGSARGDGVQSGIDIRKVLRHAPKVRITNGAIRSESDQRRLPAESKKAPLLPQGLEQLRRRGDAAEGKVLLLEVPLECVRTIWPERKHLDAAFPDLRIPLLELT